jgi:hypothetical protein
MSLMSREREEVICKVGVLFGLQRQQGMLMKNIHHGFGSHADISEVACHQ